MFNNNKLILKNQPYLLWLILIALLVTINIWRGSEKYNRPTISSLPAAPSSLAMEFVAASDQAFVYRALIFWLQQFDVQSGQYVSYKQLDYVKIKDWLNTLNKLEPSSQYPMLLASRIYTRVDDNERMRLMLEYVYQQFQRNPEKNWRWLAEATVTAQHKLKDQTLALKYANTLANEPSKEIPYWAKDLRLIILEKMGEVEQIKLLVGGLMANNSITDPNEIKFLSLLLDRIDKKEPKKTQ